MLKQFENQAHPQIHRDTTGPEIWRNADGSVDLFISGVGMGADCHTPTTSPVATTTAATTTLSQPPLQQRQHRLPQKLVSPLRPNQYQ